MKTSLPTGEEQTPTAAFLPSELPKSRVGNIFFSLGEAFMCLAAGLVVLAVTFFFTYAIIWFGYNYGISAISELVFSKRLHISHHWILTICSLFIAVLFVENVRINRDYLTSLTAPTKSLRGLTYLAGISGALVALLVNANSSAKVITDLLLTGPRLIVASLAAFRRAFGVARGETHDKQLS